MNHSKTQMKPFQAAFGADFDLGIYLPDSFSDVSYSNDVCPSFEFKSTIFPSYTVKLWVDFEDVDQREYPDSSRYTVFLINNEEESTKILETDKDIDLFYFFNNIISLLQKHNDNRPQVEIEYPSETVIDQAKREFADWYLIRKPEFLTLSSIRLWLGYNLPEFKNNEILAWEIYDGFSEFLPESC